MKGGQMDSTELLVHIEQLIHKLERENSIILTPGARLMLIIPITEHHGHSDDLDMIGTERSLSLIINKMKESIVDGRDRTYRNQQIRSSFSVVRAFAKLFCNIPPICGPD
jgi:hypothetical protein